jgi:hypothetical protein
MGKSLETAQKTQRLPVIQHLFECNRVVTMPAADAKAPHFAKEWTFFVTLNFPRLGT